MPSKQCNCSLWILRTRDRAHMRSASTDMISVIAEDRVAPLRLKHSSWSVNTYLCLNLTCEKFTLKVKHLLRQPVWGPWNTESDVHIRRESGTMPISDATNDAYAQANFSHPFETLQNPEENLRPLNLACILQLIDNQGYVSGKDLGEHRLKLQSTRGFHPYWKKDCFNQNAIVTKSWA